jgi:nucleoside-diphosphate-sugar epimerase
MQRLLLTGSSGFIGSQVLREFSKDYLIFITSRDKKKKIFSNKNITEIKFKNYDELNLKLKKLKIDTIVHCATHYIKSHKYNDIKKFVESNILFGNVILENIELMQVKKFINFSTVWENYNGKKDNLFNLYSAYKKSFSIILKYYQKKYYKVNFYNLMISETFGKSDKRKKIINVLRQNYRDNKTTSIVSKKLYLNLLNITDIANAISLIVKKKIKSGTYLLKNKNNFRIDDVIREFNKNSKKKIKIRWLTKKTLNEKILNFEKLKHWKPENSNIEKIIELIKT